MCAFLQTEADEGFHHRHRAVDTVLQPFPAFLRQSTRLDIDVLATDCAFEHLDRRVMRARQFLNDDRNIEHIAWRLQLVIECQDGLCRDRRAQRRHLAVTLAALQPVDAGPLAYVIGIG